MQRRVKRKEMHLWSGGYWFAFFFFFLRLLFHRHRSIIYSQMARCNQCQVPFLLKTHLKKKKQEMEKKIWHERNFLLFFSFFFFLVKKKKKFKTKIPIGWMMLTGCRDPGAFCLLIEQRSKQLDTASSLSISYLLTSFFSSFFLSYSVWYPPGLYYFVFMYIYISF